MRRNSDNQPKSISILLTFTLLLMVTSLKTLGQSPSQSKDFKDLFSPPQAYVVGYTAQAPEIDGNINEGAWAKAVWTSAFTDIEGTKRPNPLLGTRAKMIWDKNYLYIAAELEEPHVWANIKNHDEVIFYDNDFEVFIDPDNNTHQYFEIELNALNTVFDLFLSKPYRNNSGALISWDAKGLRSAVSISGTLNDPSDKDKGWTVEMAIPFSCISIGNDTLVPEDGSLWRLNFSRVEWNTEVTDGKYVKLKDKNGKVQAENNWVWSAQGVINMHLPERWGYIKFSTKEQPAAFSLPYAEKQKEYLWLIYYRQKEYLSKNNKYAKSLVELGIKPAPVIIDNQKNMLKMEAETTQFSAGISSGNSSWSINDEGLIQKASK